MRLTAEEMRLIQELRARRDAAAYQIGVATAQWRQTVAVQERLIEESRQAETEAGSQILRSRGLDPDAATYRFLPDGTIAELRGGVYVSPNSGAPIDTVATRVS